MRRCRINLPNRCYHLISRVAHRAFEGRQAANRKGRAAMTRKTYCGNLLWQSGLTLLAPVFLTQRRRDEMHLRRSRQVGRGRRPSREAVARACENAEMRGVGGGNVPTPAGRGRSPGGPNAPMPFHPSVVGRPVVGPYHGVAAKTHSASANSAPLRLCVKHLRTVGVSPHGFQRRHAVFAVLARMVVTNNLGGENH